MAFSHSLNKVDQHLLLLILEQQTLIDNLTHLDFLIHQAVLVAVDSKKMCSEEILVTEDNAICVFHIITECGVLAAV